MYMIVFVSCCINVQLTYLLIILYSYLDYACLLYILYLPIYPYLTPLLPCPGWLRSSCCFGNPRHLYGLDRTRARRSEGGGEARRKVIKREFTSVQCCWLFSWDTKPLWENESALKWVSGIKRENRERDEKRWWKRESGISEVTDLLKLIGT